MAEFPEPIDPNLVERLTADQKIEAVFRGTCALSKFAEEHVCPIIIGQIGRTPFEQAIAATYYRMCLFMQALARLHDPRHFQMAQIAARSVFELLLDLKALVADPALTVKFFDFVDVSRFYGAKKLVDFLQGHPRIDTSPHQAAIALIRKPGVEQDRKRRCALHGWVDNKGKPKCPDHWSGKKIRERARDAGTKYEELYRSDYFIQCYYVHAGGGGVVGFSREALATAFGLAHGLIQPLFSEATEIVAGVFHLFEADADLRRRLQAAAAAGYYTVLLSVGPVSEAD